MPRSLQKFSKSRTREKRIRMPKKPTAHSRISQGKRFVEAAHKLGLDKEANTFDRALKKVASAPPPKSVEKRKQKPGKDG